jgi:hypothetical protein
MNIEIKFDVEKSLGGHENISVNIPKINLHIICDSYYFALDNSFMPNVESTYKVITSLIENLGYWINCAENINYQTIKYLPVDLSDEYVGFLVLNKNNNDMLSIKYGVTKELNGYSVNAYKPDEFNVKNPRIISKELVILKNEFIVDINASISYLKSLRNMTGNISD